MTTSWVIVDKETRVAVCELFDKRKLKYLNTIHYEAVPAMEYLQEVNAEIKRANLTSKQGETK